MRRSRVRSPSAPPFTCPSTSKCFHGCLWPRDDFGSYHCGVHGHLIALYRKGTLTIGVPGGISSSLKIRYPTLVEADGRRRFGYRTCECGRSDVSDTAWAKRGSNGRHRMHAPLGRTLRNCGVRRKISEVSSSISIRRFRDAIRRLASDKPRATPGKPPGAAGDFTHDAKPRAAYPGRRQCHARRNSSRPWSAKPEDRTGVARRGVSCPLSKPDRCPYKYSTSGLRWQRSGQRRDNRVTKTPGRLSAAMEAG